jgi:hypothetical protein
MISYLFDARCTRRDIIFDERSGIFCKYTLSNRNTVTETVADSDIILFFSSERESRFRITFSFSCLLGDFEGILFSISFVVPAREALIQLTEFAGKISSLKEE